MSSFIDVVTPLLRAAQSPDPTDRRNLIALSRTLSAQIATASSVEREQALAQMRPVIIAASAGPASLVAVTAGAIVESGTSAEAVAEPIVERLEMLLDTAEPFIQAYLSSEEKVQGVSLRQYSTAKHQLMTNAVSAWAGVPWFSLSAKTMLSVSDALRARTLAAGKLPAKIALLAAQNLDDNVNALHGFLKSAKPERLVVLVPLTGQAFRLQMSGITGNFQLHTLLADALIGDPGDGWLAGRPPDTAAVAAACGEVNELVVALGVFNLVAWQALRSDRTVNTQTEYWIWGEGTPDDIPFFEGTRTLLLTPPALHAQLDL